MSEFPHIKDFDKTFDKIFGTLDIDKNGSITFDEACTVIKVLNNTLLRSYSFNDVEEFMTGLDTNSDGKIEQHELKENYMKLVNRR